MPEQFRLTIVAVSLIVVAGACEAIGFTYVAKIWQDNPLPWKTLLHSAWGFASGIALYWFTVRYFGELGLVSPELETLIWFGTIFVGVAMLNG